jgi:hypothetical protein
LKKILNKCRFEFRVVVFDCLGLDHKDNPYGDVGSMVSESRKIFIENNQIDSPGDGFKGQTSFK